MDSPLEEVERLYHGVDNGIATAAGHEKDATLCIYILCIV
jgi:hypothetical protein